MSVRRLIQSLLSLPGGAQLTASLADELADAIWLASRNVFTASSRRIDAYAPLSDEPPHTAVDEPMRIEPDEIQGDVSAMEADDLAAEIVGTIQPEPDPEENLDLSAELDSSTHEAAPDEHALMPARQSGIPIRTPAAKSLPAAAALMRSLKPLRRRIDSRTQRTLDEDATVLQVAELGMWLPVMRAMRVRRFELAFVIDQSESLALWQDTIRELRLLFEQLGAFRDVRTWRLAADDTGHIVLRAASSSPPRSPRELFDPERQRVIIVVSDCVHPAWCRGALTGALASWGQRQPLALLQILPQSLWRRTALDPARGVTHIHVGSSRPLSANASLRRRLWRARREDPAPSGVPIPVIAAQPEVMESWAMLLSRATAPRLPGIIFPSEPSDAGYPELSLLASSRNATTEVQALLRAFFSNASQTAAQLTRLFAAAPLHLPVMRLIQRVMLPQSHQTHLAEFFLSGLIAGLKESVTERKDYDFLPGVRSALLDSSTAADAVQVQRQVSRFISERFGQTFDFDAILAAPDDVDSLALADVDRVFARVSAEVLRRLGGKYARAAERVMQRAAAPAPGCELAFANTRILWIDDEPDGNARFADELEQYGAVVTQTVSSTQARLLLSRAQWDAVISDIHRRDDTCEGLMLLDELRFEDDLTLFAIYSGRAEMFREQALSMGACVCSSNAFEVRDALAQALMARRASAPPLPAPLLQPLRERELSSLINRRGLPVIPGFTGDSPDSTADKLLTVEDRWIRLWVRLASDTQYALSNSIAEIAAIGLGADRAVLWSISPRGVQLAADVTGAREQFIAAPLVTSQVAGAALETGRTQYWRDFRSGHLAGFSCMAAVPLKESADSNVVAVIALLSTRPFAFNLRELAWLERAMRPAARRLSEVPQPTDARSSKVLAAHPDAAALLDLRSAKAICVILHRLAVRLADLAHSYFPRWRGSKAVQYEPAFQRDIWGIETLVEARLARPRLSRRDQTFLDSQDRTEWEGLLEKYERLGDNWPNQCIRAAFTCWHACMQIAQDPKVNIPQAVQRALADTDTAIEHLHSREQTALRAHLRADLDETRGTLSTSQRNVRSAELFYRLGAIWNVSSSEPHSRRRPIRPPKVVWVSGSFPKGTADVGFYLGAVLAIAGFGMVRSIEETDSDSIIVGYRTHVTLAGNELRHWLTSTTTRDVARPGEGRVILCQHAGDEWRMSAAISNVLVEIPSRDRSPDIQKIAVSAGLPMLALTNTGRLRRVGEMIRAIERDDKFVSHRSVTQIPGNGIGASALLRGLLRAITDSKKSPHSWRLFESPRVEFSPALHRARGIVLVQGYRRAVAMGVLLQEPRVILTAPDLVGPNRTVVVMGPGFHVHRARVLTNDLTGGGLGPAVVSVPAGVNLEGLAASGAPVPEHATLQVIAPPGVSATASFGRFSRDSDKSDRLLVSLPADRVGAPVLDARGRVRGIVITAADDQSTRIISTTQWIVALTERLSELESRGTQPRRKKKAKTKRKTRS